MKTKTCFETIKVENGKLLNLEYHQKRVDYTREKLFTCKEILDLKKEIKKYPKEGVYRLRVDYDKEIKSLTCKEYRPRSLCSFKVVEANIDYEYKYSNREELNKLLDENYDDIVILKNGFLSDTSIANIALKIDGIWLTPKTPLLHGTTRERLLAEGFLKCDNLSIKDLEKSEKFAIMNALVGFKIIKNLRIDI
ncbi:aminotransferase class IV [Sulfurospirillum arcachonense]|uniref:aminotransferase class IV n=1 Tax=Sulfurospirillum arcachonense TaxID=57666 RepID=UPI00046A2BAA|nr:aminotransferase class IV [Sulfurospirillum arcachonense]